MRLSLLITAAFATLASCSVLPRQATNTNPAISAVVDALSQSVWLNIPDLEKNIANQTNNKIDGDLSNLISAFDGATAALNNIQPSSGSNTTSPTDNEIHVTFAALLSQVASGLSSLTTDRIQDKAQQFATLDTSIANTITRADVVSAGTIEFLQIMLRDARQFFGLDGFTKSLGVMGVSGTL